MFSKEKLEELRAKKARQAEEAAVAVALLEAQRAGEAASSAAGASAQALTTPRHDDFLGATRAELAAQKDALKQQLRYSAHTLNAQELTALKTRLTTLSTRLSEPLSEAEVLKEREVAQMALVREQEARKTQELRLRDVFKQLDAAQQVDLAFLCDCTGSMERYVAEVHEAIDKVVQRIKRTSPRLQMRLAFVGYRDFDTHSGPSMSLLDFVDDVRTFKNFVARTTCVANNDICEDVASGLRAATNLLWRNRARVLYHICDAPSHGTLYHNFGTAYGADLHANHPSVHEIPGLLAALKQLDVTYFFCSVNAEITEKMVCAFNAHVPQSKPFVTSLRLDDMSKLADQAVSSVRTTIMTSTDALRGASLRTVTVDAVSGMVNTESIARQLAALGSTTVLTNRSYAHFPSDTTDWSAVQMQRVRS